MNKLEQYTDEQLFKFAADILGKPGKLTEENLLELKQINDEFVNRERKMNSWRNALTRNDSVS